VNPRITPRLEAARAIAEHMGPCRALCEEMAGSQFELAVEVS